MVSCITSYIPLRPRTKPAVTLKSDRVAQCFYFYYFRQDIHKVESYLACKMRPAATMRPVSKKSTASSVRAILSIKS